MRLALESAQLGQYEPADDAAGNGKSHLSRSREHGGVDAHDLPVHPNERPAAVAGADASDEADHRYLVPREGPLARVAHESRGVAVSEGMPQGEELFTYDERAGITQGQRGQGCEPAALDVAGFIGVDFNEGDIGDWVRSDHHALLDRAPHSGRAQRMVSSSGPNACADSSAARTSG